MNTFTKWSAIAFSMGLLGVPFSSHAEGNTQTSLGINETYRLLRFSVQDLEYAKDLKSKVVESSDPSIMTATASLEVSPMSFAVAVQQLATNEIWIARFSGLQTSVTSVDADLKITVRGVERILQVQAGTHLAALARQMNEANLGVHALAYDTGSGGIHTAALSIMDIAEGKWNADPTPGINFNLALSSSLTDLSTADFGSEPVVEGRDAVLRVNFDHLNPVYSDSNIVSGVFPGIALNLLRASPEHDVWLRVVGSMEGGIDKLDLLVERYNAFYSGIYEKILTTDDPDQIERLGRALNELSEAFAKSMEGFPDNLLVHSTQDLGIGPKTDISIPDYLGLLQLNREHLGAVLHISFDDAVMFFEGYRVGENGQTIIEGFAHRFLGDLERIRTLYLKP